MKTLLPAVLILLLCGSIAKSQTPSPASHATDCSRFVQKFYDWYLARDTAPPKGHNQESAEEAALREKQSSFSPALVKALKADLAASKKSPGEVTGLDFDPFMNTQEVPLRCRVGKVTAQGTHYLVGVFVTVDKKESPKPDVTPELAFENGHWIFINFHYPDTGDPENKNLLALLQQLKKERRKQGSL